VGTENAIPAAALMNGLVTHPFADYTAIRAMSQPCHS
jgi:hypothetical protein